MATKKENTGSEIVSRFMRGFKRLLCDFSLKSKNGTNDYVSSLTLADMVQIKQDLSGINGIVTMLTEVAFVDKLEQKGLLDKTQHDGLIKEIRETSPYANGYDIRSKNPKIVAEVKCNCPINEKSFGAKQIELLIKDIKGLHDLSFKTKEGVSIDEHAHYNKFMVLLDSSTLGNQHDFSTAVENLIAQLKRQDPEIDLEWFDKASIPLNHNTVYIVTVPLSNLELSILK